MRRIVICGSTSFAAEIQLCMHLLALSGVTAIAHGGYGGEWEDPRQNPATAALLDMLHLAKISDHADAVLVVDTTIGEVHPALEGHGYYGVSTAKEILWTAMNDIPVAFLTDLIGDGVSVEQAMKDLVDKLIDGELLTMHVDPALEIVNRAMGRERVDRAQTDTKRDVMHATLSEIADRAAMHPDMLMDCPRIAKDALTFLDLVVLPVPDRQGYMQMIDPNSSAHDREVIGG